MSAAQLHQTRRQLQSVRMRLSDVIKDYYAACQSLEAICSTVSLVTLPRPPELEQTLQVIEKELSEFSLDDAVIRKSRNIIAGIHNRSNMTAAVYSLPSEILSRIFSEAACYCTRSPQFDNVLPILSPVVISSVCRQWRKIAINQPSLWAHIDVNARGGGVYHGYHASDLWLERAKGAPMFVHIRNHFSFGNPLDDEGSSDQHDEENPNPTLQRLSDFLSPLMPHVCSLDLDFPWPLEYIFNMLFKCWLSCGTTGRAKSLRVRSTSEFNPLDLSLPQSSSQFLGSLESLCLYNAMFSIPDFTLGNLTNLQLKVDDYRWDMSQVELANMIASCPKLLLLSLDSLHLGAGDLKDDSNDASDNSATLNNDSNQKGPKPSAVALSELIVLDIGGLTSLRSAAYILEVVNPRPNMTTMGLPLSNQSIMFSDRWLSTVDSFLNRVKPKTLHVYGSLRKPSFGHTTSHVASC